MGPPTLAAPLSWLLGEMRSKSPPATPALFLLSNYLSSNSPSGLGSNAFLSDSAVIVNSPNFSKHPHGFRYSREEAGPPKVEMLGEA